jgi:hypothetical protein
VIQHNEIRDNHSENAAIYIYDAEHIRIECNLIDNVTQNDGIKLGTKRGGDAGNSGGSILNNTVLNTAQDGITVYMSDTLVEGNDVSSSTSENGAIYVAWAVSNVTIQKNNVHDNTLQTFKWGDPGAIMIGTAVNAGTVFVNNNNLTGNFVNGLTNKAVALLDGENNWWGDAAGPNAAGDSVSANVDFDPWLTAPQVIPDPCAPPTPMDAKMGVLDGLSALLPSGDKKTDKRIERAIKDINRSLEGDLWETGSTLTRKGKRVFYRERKAVRGLMKIAPLADPAILELVAIDAALAQIAVDEAVADCVDPCKFLDKAQAEMTNAEEASAEGEPDDAINHYKKAWYFSQKALKKCVDEEED